MATEDFFESLFDQSKSEERARFHEALEAALDSFWNDYALRWQYDDVARKITISESRELGIGRLFGKRPERMSSYRIRGIFNKDFRYRMIVALRAAQQALEGKTAEELFVPSLRVLSISNDVHQIEFWYKRDHPPLMLGEFPTYDDGLSWLKSNANRLMQENGICAEKIGEAVIFG